MWNRTNKWETDIVSGSLLTYWTKLFYIFNTDSSDDVSSHEQN